MQLNFQNFNGKILSPTQLKTIKGGNDGDIFTGNAADFIITNDMVDG